MRRPRSTSAVAVAAALLLTVFGCKTGAEIACAPIRTYQKHPDGRYLAWIEKGDECILHGQFRLADGTHTRQRPQPRSLWTDDFCMSISFPAQRARMAGDRRYFDDAVRQMVQHGGAGPNTTFSGSALYAGLEVMKLVKHSAVTLTLPRPGAVNSAMHGRGSEELRAVREYPTPS